MLFLLGLIVICMGCGFLSAEGGDFGLGNVLGRQWGADHLESRPFRELRSHIYGGGFAAFAGRGILCLLRI